MSVIFFQGTGVNYCRILMCHLSDWALFEFTTDIYLIIMFHLGETPSSFLLQIQ